MLVFRFLLSRLSFSPLLWIAGESLCLSFLTHYSYFFISFNSFCRNLNLGTPKGQTRRINCDLKLNKFQQTCLNLGTVCQNLAKFT